MRRTSSAREAWVFVRQGEAFEYRVELSRILAAILIGTGFFQAGRLIGLSARGDPRIVVLVIVVSGALLGLAFSLGYSVKVEVRYDKSIPVMILTFTPRRRSN